MDFQDLIKAKIPGYLLKRQEDVKNLKKFLAEKNWPEIKMIGHQLKGNGPTFGFPEIGEIGSLLEEAADQQAGQGIPALINRLEQVLGNAKT